MNYIALLTQEERTILCKIITGRNFKELFKKNEHEFSKIQGGFRAKSLTEKFALSIAENNIDRSFIAIYVNKTVEMWTREIQENIDKLEEQGMTHDIALATSVLDSVFSNNVDLYLKLIESNLDDNSCSKLYENIESVKSERIRNAEVAERVRSMEEEKCSLLNQIEDAQKNVDGIRREYEQKIQKIEQEKDALKSELNEAQEKIAELQTASNADKRNDREYLTWFDDTDISNLPSIDSNEIVSLCCVTSEYSEQKWLVRYADLNHNGQYYIFRKSEDRPPYFANRDKIFYKDGPSDVGFYGIWIWSAIPNAKDPSKDYILSRYSVDLDAIEVFTILEAWSLDDLIKQLKMGIEYKPRSRRVMFSVYMSKGQYMGVLCNIKELNVVNGKIILDEECIEVPVYEFASDDILHLDNGLSFYKKAFAGIPNELYQLKSTINIVKDIVLSSISWTAYKTRGLARSEYKAFKEFLDAIPVDDITCKIKTTCHCSDSAAKELLDEFRNAVLRYVDGDSLEDEIVLSAISASDELQERTKALIRMDWETENRNLLVEGQEKLDTLKAQLESATVNLNKVQEAYNKTKSKEEQITNIIAEKEKLAEDVEAAVAQRIQKARENAAEFIADMAFAGGQPIRDSAIEAPAVVEVTSQFVANPYHVIPAFDDPSDLEAHHSWAEAINTVVFEFGEAGVVEKYRSGLAAFLCAAYIEKQPILLVGPNAIDIVQAFSAAVTGHKHGILCCEGNYSNQIIAEIGTDGEDIVIINNLFASGWMNRLPEILARKDIFYIAIHPYAEDIQVEPKSLYGFMLPLFTEFLVDKKATGEYGGGYFAKDFKIYSESKCTCKDLRALSKLKISSLIRNQVNRLVTTIHGIYPEITTDEEFLFSILPIAYASLETNELAEMIAASQKGFEISESLKRELQYILGEI